MQRINTEQHNEIERIEDSKGYNQKIESLLNELAVSNQKNKEYEQSKEIIEEWKKVNNIQIS